MSADDLLPYKADIIDEMYLHTADENYIVARWAHHNQLFTDFFWNAAHALEKYMKAVLLFNGRSVKLFSHGVVKLYNIVEEIAEPLLPTFLTKPENLIIYNWVNLSPQEYIEKIDQNGSADNRYLTYGYNHNVWYLHMLDKMVWVLRRLARPLDEPIIPRSQLATAPTNRQVLERQPEYGLHLLMPLEKLISGSNSEARSALLNNNCAFAPENFQHEPGYTISATRNPVLLRRVIEPLRSDVRETARHGYAMATWVLADIKQSKAVTDKIAAVMRDALAKHPGIDKPKP